MTEDEMRDLIRPKVIVAVYDWKCPLCGLTGDESRYKDLALEDLRYHINEDHKGED